MTVPSDDDIPQRRSTDNEAVMEIRRQELERLARIEENNQRLLVATESLADALHIFATKEEVNTKVQAVEDRRAFTVRRFTFYLIVIGVFIFAGIASTVGYLITQHVQHETAYQTCLQRNDQTDAFRTFLEKTIAQGQKAGSKSPILSDLITLERHYPSVRCHKQWP